MQPEAVTHLTNPRKRGLNSIWNHSGTHARSTEDTQRTSFALHDGNTALHWPQCVFSLPQDKCETAPCRRQAPMANRVSTA